jgi:hypothetical protein
MQGKRDTEETTPGDDGEELDPRAGGDDGEDLDPRATGNDGEELDPRATGDDGEDLDPRAAARLLAQTEREARRQFDLGPPWVTAFGGGVILLAYGALWLSVRGQRPYTGPSLGVIALVYAAVAVSIAVSARVYRRATAGVEGPAVRRQQLEGVAILVSLILGSPVLQGALKHYGAGPAIVYGVIPAAAPLIIVGTTVVGIAASKADWPQFGAALAVVTGGALAAFAGPSGAWLVAGIGMFVGVVVYALARARRQRA